MIYDLNINNKIIPNIIYLGNKLKINPIVNKSWDKLSKIEQEELSKLWNEFINSDDTNQISLKSLLLFYIRWEKDNDNLDEIMSKKCQNKIKRNIENNDENDDEIENAIYDNKNLLDRFIEDPESLY